MTKEDIEGEHVLAFWKHLGEFSGTSPKRQAPPEPDFCLETAQGSIGIEHTRLVRQKDQQGVNMMGHDWCANQIMELAEQQFSYLSDLKLYVSVSFRCDHGLIVPNPTYLSNRDIQPLAKFIANFVHSNIPELDNHYTIERYDPYTYAVIFPEEMKINTISIYHWDQKTSQPCWTLSQAAMIPRMFKSTAFTTTVNKKNQKPKNYQRNYYQIWLVIVEDQRNLTTYFDVKHGEIPQLPSTFDRVFVFRYASEEIIELRVLPTQSNS